MSAKRRGYAREHVRYYGFYSDERGFMSGLLEDVLDELEFVELENAQLRAAVRFLRPFFEQQVRTMSALTSGMPDEVRGKYLKAFADTQTVLDGLDSRPGFVLDKPPHL